MPYVGQNNRGEEVHFKNLIIVHISEIAKKYLTLKVLNATKLIARVSIVRISHQNCGQRG